MQELSNEHERRYDSSSVPFWNKLLAACSIRVQHKPRIRNLRKYQLWKGIFDRLFGLLATIALSPFIILIAILIGIDSPGNPIFRQERIGKEGRRFFIYKFRTMHIEHDDSAYEAFLQGYVGGDTDRGTWKKIKENLNQSRTENVTRIGAILRKTNLDELPQLFNLVRGEMSLVGPRPDIPFTVAMYKDHHCARLGVTPGITGLWQVSGRKKVSFKDMVRLDIEYIKRQSLLLDIKILFLTVFTILKGEGS